MIFMFLGWSRGHGARYICDWKRVPVVVEVRHWGCFSSLGPIQSEVAGIHGATITQVNNACRQRGSSGCRHGGAATANGLLYFIYEKYGA